MSSCENGVSLIVGLIAGALVGLFLVAFLAYISDRRLTNILAFPLIRNRAADGKPIYVCEKAIKKPTPVCAKPMNQKEATNLQLIRQMLERGSQKLGIPISPDKLDDFATFFANNADPNTGNLDGRAQNELLTIRGITMEQLQQIQAAGK
jgi:hypothetical protein